MEETACLDLVLVPCRFVHIEVEAATTFIYVMEISYRFLQENQITNFRRKITSARAFRGNISISRSISITEKIYILLVLEHFM